MFTYEKKKSSVLIPKKRSHAIWRVFYELKAWFYNKNIQKFRAGSPSEVDLGGYAHAFDKYLAQHHESVCGNLICPNLKKNQN